MKIAYLDCFSGISGDMFLGALLDAGLPPEILKLHLKSLPLGGYHINITREARNRIFGTRFSVMLDEKKPISRDLDTIREIIQKSELSIEVKNKSISIFEEIARVEGKIHGIPAKKVHFHEVGAVDSIIDIVGVLIGIEHLRISSIYSSHIPLGSGLAESVHGTIPIPSPATIELLKGIPVFDSGVLHEMVTPTGAALVKSLAISFGAMPPMVVHNVGYGAGKRDFTQRPNLLRILIGEFHSDQDVETVITLETNLDDASPEWMGYLMERLFEAGALDVAFCAIQMKKNRPGVQVQVIGRPDQKESLMGILFQESTALGVRYQYTQRLVLERTDEEVSSPWGKIKVKKIINRDGSYFFQPEYEACREIALKQKMPLREIFHWVMGLKK